MEESKMSKEQEGIRSTLEEIRASLHPEIPSSILDEIIDIQVAYQDDADEAMRKTRSVIDKFLDSHSYTE